LNIMTKADVVIDTSAILAVLLCEPERQGLLSVTRGATLCAPPSVPWEVGNALSSLIKRRRLSASQAQLAIRSFGRIPLHEVSVDLGRAVQLAAEFGLCAYDAYLLEAARAGGCGLLTLDRSLAKAATAAGLAVVEVPS
jgi:predicted nucleic acid-binding protein